MAAADADHVILGALLDPDLGVGGTEDNVGVGRGQRSGVALNILLACRDIDAKITRRVLHHVVTDVGVIVRGTNDHGIAVHLLLLRDDRGRRTGARRIAGVFATRVRKGCGQTKPDSGGENGFLEIGFHRLIAPDGFFV